MRYDDLAQPLYVSRPVLNGNDIVEWAKSQGLESMLYPNDLHVTVCYSKEPLVWDDVPVSDEKVVVPEATLDETDQPIRQMEMFGKEQNVLVIQIESDELHARWQEFCDHGASYDFPEYKPHITITYKGGGLKETTKQIEPYRGEIVLGPERFKRIDRTWAGDVPEIALKEEEPLPFDELSETVADDLVVLTNPSVSQLRSLFQRSRERELRGLLTDDAVYLWDAYSAVHAEIIRRLGLADATICFHLNSDGIEVDISDVGFVVDDTDSAEEEYQESDIAWFKEMHTRIRHGMVQLQEMPSLKRFYRGHVHITVDDPPQWDDLCTFVARLSENITHADEITEDTPPRPEALGREPAKPRSFFGYMAEKLARESKAAGLSVRIEAEDAIDKGVPREYLLHSSGAAKAPANKVFSSRYGSMKSKEVRYISLDMDDLDPQQWGHEGRVENLEPEEIGDLFRKSFEGDPDALDRYDARYAPWMEWQHLAASSMEFYDRFGDDGALHSDDDLKRIMSDHPPISLPADEVIDLWEPPPEEDSYGAGPERFKGVPPRLTEARVENVGGIRVILNPLPSQLAQLCDHEELRGVTDGKNVYVWPSYAGIHMHVMNKLGISLEHYPTRFYAFIPEFGETDKDFAKRLEGNNGLSTYRIPCGVVIAVSAHALPSMRAASATISRWFTPREPRPMAQPVMEAASDPLPKKFWLCFDVPCWKPNDEQQNERFEKQLADISSGELHGVRGISDTREIVLDWFLMARNACVVMDPNAVAAENDIEKIQYSDPEYLCANNMAALYRIWDKESRVGNTNHEGMYQNFAQYVIAAIKRQESWLGMSMQNNGVESRAARLWKEKPVGVNSVASAGQKFYDLVMEVAEREKSGWSYWGNIKESLTPEICIAATRMAVEYVGKLYSNEGEWVVSSDRFHIPHNSIMMLGVDMETYHTFHDWKAGKIEDPFRQKAWRYENLERLLTAVEEYRLRDRYALRFVDARKFEAMRGDVMGKRRRRREAMTESPALTQLPPIKR
jgi:hypothetical protein